MNFFLTSYIELMHLQSEMNKLFEALQKVGLEEEDPELEFVPPYDIVETPEDIIVEMDLPGIDPSSVRIHARGNNVTIACQRIKPDPGRIREYHLMERGRGRIERTLRVDGAFNPRRASAEYRRGVLVLSLPRVRDRRGSEVRIPLSQDG